MYDFCVKNISGIKFFKVLNETAVEHKKTLLSRFEQAKTVQGTQQFHRFVPISHSHLQAFKISSQNDPPKLVSVTDDLDQADVAPDVAPEIVIHEQNYLCCCYENHLYVGLVEQMSTDHGDVFINFMTPYCPSKQFCWPKKEDKCWVKYENIKFVLKTPSLSSSSLRGYSLDEADSLKIEILLAHI